MGMGMGMGSAQQQRQEQQQQNYQGATGFEGSGIDSASMMGMFSGGVSTGTFDMGGGAAGAAAFQPVTLSVGSDNMGIGASGMSGARGNDPGGNQMGGGTGMAGAMIGNIATGGSMQSTPSLRVQSQLSQLSKALSQVGQVGQVGQQLPNTGSSENRSHQYNNL